MRDHFTNLLPTITGIPGERKAMKVYTIEKCGDCPSYIADHGAYYDEFGVCGRDRSNTVQDDQIPPLDCPLKDWEEV